MNFVYAEYQDPFYAVLIEDKELFSSVNNRCMKFYCVYQVLKCIEEQSFFCEQLRADTRVMILAKYANVKEAKNI